MATYTTTSKYVQLTPYLVMEYMYAAQPNPETYFVNNGGGNPTVGFNKLINGILEYKGSPTNEVQIFNLDENYAITQNTALNNVVKTSENSFIPLNPNLIVPYNDFNPKLTPTSNLEISFPSNISVVYDTVRYHILQGYNLENIDGLVLSIAFLDQDGSFVTFSQIELSSGTAQNYTLDPNPLTIGSNIYDKYFQINVPSLVDMNNQYAAATAPNKPNTLAGKTSRSGRGYVTGSPMRISVWQINDITQVNGYDQYGVTLYATLSLESEDPFSNVGAYIAPAESGDYFEYFATDNGGFIENFILFQNSIGNQYYIDHKVETVEQIGAAFIATNNFSTIQTTAFDIPLLYRPIIRYSSVAAGFTLRYTMTLVNSVGQSRLVRNASYTSLDPARYGPYIAPLQLSVFPQTQKIYNRLANQSNISVPANAIVPKEIVKYQNVFVENNTVNLTMSNLSVKGTTISQADSGVTETISYGLGQAYIRISPFDNYYKFTFYKRNANGTMDLLDLTSSGTFKLVFIDNKNNKLFAPSIADKNLANAAQGELAFKVDQSLSNQILTFTNRRFYVSNQPIIAETNSVAGRLPFSRLSGVKQRLASKALSTTDSIRDAQLAAQDLTTTDNSLGTARISGSSSSVLYYGRWLKDSEPIPSIQMGAGTSGLGSPVNQSNITTAANGESQTSGSGLTPVQSYWQRVFLSGGTSGTSGANTTGGIGIQTQVLNALGIVAFKAAIASDVQGKIASGWSSNQIIDYFLNPSGVGFRVYSGITKQIFTDAVTGIFSTEDLALLNVYGNTGGGQDTGGTAASGGSTSNQSGSDSGSAGPQFPPIPPRNSGGITRRQPGRPRGTF
jgi:hypothetical protein